MPKIYSQLKKISGLGTKYISFYFGDRFPFYYVTEYPRSGGTWIAHLLSDYLQIPFPKNSIVPLGFSCVIHNHWGYSKRLHLPVYVVRDGRDVAVSMMFYAMRRVQYENYYARRFPSLLNINKTQYKNNFYNYLKEWFESPVGCRKNWANHVKDWLYRKKVVLVKYEDFKRDTSSALKKLLLDLGNDHIDEELLALSIKKYSFKVLTKREPGIEDRLSNKRKAIIGDWKNYFDQNSARLFHSYTGNLLVELDYEKDTLWYKTCSENL